MVARKNENKAVSNRLNRAAKKLAISEQTAQAVGVSPDLKAEPATPPVAEGRPQDTQTAEIGPQSASAPANIQPAHTTPAVQAAQPPSPSNVAPANIAPTSDPTDSVPQHTQTSLAGEQLNSVPWTAPVAEQKSSSLPQAVQPTQLQSESTSPITSTVPADIQLDPLPPSAQMEEPKLEAVQTTLPEGQTSQRLFVPVQRAQAETDPAQPSPSPGRRGPKPDPDIVRERGSAAGLHSGWERVTLIVRSEYVKKLKDYAYTERLSIKEATDQMFRAFLDDKDNLLERPERFV